MTEDPRPVFATKEAAFEALARALREQPQGVPFREMPAKVSKLELAEFIADVLCETEPEPITQVLELVGKVGQGYAFNAVRCVNEVEAEGGMLLRDGSRRKTPGGIWFHLCSCHAARLEKEQRKREAKAAAAKGAEQRTKRRVAEVRKDLRQSTAAATAGTKQAGPPVRRTAPKPAEVEVVRRSTGGAR